MLQNLNRRRLSVLCMIHDCSWLLLFGCTFGTSARWIYISIQNTICTQVQMRLAILRAGKKNRESWEIWESHKRVASHPSMAGFLTAIEVPSWDAQGHIPEKSRRGLCIKNTWTQLMTLIVSHLSPKAFTILSCLDQLELSGSILHKLTFFVVCKPHEVSEWGIFKPNLCYTVRGEVTEIMDKLEPRHGHPKPVESSETHKLCPRLVASVGAGQLSPKNVWQRWPWQSLSACTYTPVSHCITRSCKFPSPFFYSLGRCQVMDSASCKQKETINLQSHHDGPCHVSEDVWSMWISQYLQHWKQIQSNWIQEMWLKWGTIAAPRSFAAVSSGTSKLLQISMVSTRLHA